MACGRRGILAVAFFFVFACEPFPMADGGFFHLFVGPAVGMAVWKKCFFASLFGDRHDRKLGNLLDGFPRNLYRCDGSGFWFDGGLLISAFARHHSSIIRKGHDLVDCFEPGFGPCIFVCAYFGFACGICHGHGDYSNQTIHSTKQEWFLRISGQAEKVCPFLFCGKKSGLG